MERSMTLKKWIDRVVYLGSMTLSRLLRPKNTGKTLVVNRILCFKEDEIGDFMYAIPVFETLKRRFPESEITVLCRPFGVQLLKENPHVHLATSQYGDLSGKFDLHVDLRGTMRSLFFAILHPPSIRVDRGTVRYKHRKAGSHPSEIETNYEIIAPLVGELENKIKPVIYLSQADREKALTFIQQNHLDRFAIFHTGARRKLKKWPLERVAETMKWLYHQKGIQPVLAGDESDKADAELLQPMLDFKLCNAAGSLSLRTFAALCEKSAIFIGNDSGPLHIACAMKTPSLGLFGPGDPIFHPSGKHTRYIHHILECNPCDQVHCKYPEHPCILRITSEEVRSAIVSLLEYQEGNS